MLFTDSVSNGIICAPFLAAVPAFHYRPMLETDTALLDLIVTPVLAAAHHSCPMLDTDSAFLDLIVACLYIRRC
jgi:hypothetical protein